MIRNLEDLYQLRDLYSVETQLIAALSKMVSSSSDDVHRKAFAHHLEKTKGTPK